METSGRPLPLLANDPLPAMLFGRARAALLGILFVQPEREFYFRELSRLTGLSTSSLRREVVALRQAGVVEQREHANLVYYRANAGHPCYPELKSLVEKTAGVAPQLQAALLPLAKRIDHALIYGSFAAGTAKAASDIDLFVIGSVTFGEVVEALHPLEERIGRPIAPTVYSPKEFRERLAEGHSFVRSVLQKPRIDLIGTSDGLAKSRQPRAARTASRGAAAPGRNKPAARGRRRQSR